MNLENRADLRANEHNESASRASREHQLALTVAAGASLIPKLPRWWLYLHVWSGLTRYYLNGVVQIITKK